MRKFTELLLLSVICWTTALAQKSVSLVNEGEITSLRDARTERTITPTTDGYKVKYEIKSVQLLDDPLFPENDTWYVQGFYTSGVPEYPQYPYSSDSFVIPEGCEATVEVTNAEWLSVASLPSPGRPIKAVSDTVGYTKDNVPPLLNNISGLYPESNVEVIDSHFYKGYEILRVGISPVQFNLEKGLAQVCKTLEYEVRFEPKQVANAQMLADNTGAVKSLTASDKKFLSLSTINWDHMNSDADKVLRTVTSVQPIPVSTPEYLIIASDACKEASEKLATWKRTLGFNVVVKSKDKWTAQEIKSEVEEHPELSYLLLFGNNATVPGIRRRFQLSPDVPSIISDKGYACISSSAYPDFYYGRIPANTGAEALNVVNKIIDYERNPTNPDEFYKSELYMSQWFGKKPIPGARNTQTTYEIANYVAGKGRNTKLLFTALEEANPTYWSDPGYNDNGVLVGKLSVPTSFRKPYYPWTVNTLEVISEINKGYSQVFYYGHGSPYGWESPAFSTNNISELTNKRKYPVVYSFACQTGDFSKTGCLAESLLTAEEQGAVSVFGFTETTYEAYTDIMAIGLFNGLWPFPGIKSYVSEPIDSIMWVTKVGNEKSTELGVLHNLSMNALNSKLPTSKPYAGSIVDIETSMFTLFGDPSLCIPLEKPVVIQPSLKIENNIATLEVPDGCIITIYNTIKGTVANYTRSARFATNRNDKIICIHGENVKPIVMEPSGIARLADASSEADAPSESEPLISEDKVWVYHIVSSHTMSPGNDITLRVQFKGETNIDGIDYYNCYAYLGTDLDSSDSATIIAYMREENGKVYVRYSPQAVKEAREKGIDVIPYSPVTSILGLPSYLEKLAKKEVLLYDSTLGIGDMLTSNEIGNEYAKVFQVQWIKEMTWNGISKRVFDYTGYNYIEGVGDYSGLLPFPNSRPLCLGDTWRLVEVTDLSGNTLFKVTTISSVSDLNNAEEEPFYTNLQGIRVTNPEEPGIYIRTSVSSAGEKNVEKVFVR